MQDPLFGISEANPPDSKKELSKQVVKDELLRSSRHFIECWIPTLGSVKLIPNQF